MAVANRSDCVTVSCRGVCSSSSAAHSHANIRLGCNILEQFDSDDLEANADRWITKIDQSGDINGWSVDERGYYAQNKLRCGEEVVSPLT